MIKTVLCYWYSVTINCCRIWNIRCIRIKDVKFLLNNSIFVCYSHFFLKTIYIGWRQAACIVVANVLIAMTRVPD